MIGMFDSGLGGLSVWQAINYAMPDWPVTYVADQAYCPYGPRSKEEITERSLTIGHWLSQQGASLLVVACNTATSAAVEAMRRELSTPVVAIEPAVKPAALASKTGRIAVLATEFMLKSARFKRLLQQYAGNVQVLPRAGCGWVECVENGDLQSERTRQRVADVITPLLAEHIDHIVLGCTHYPFLAPLIHELIGQAIQLDDPAAAIARRVQALLASHPAPSQATQRFCTTSAEPSDMSQTLPVLIGQDHPVESLDL